MSALLQVKDLALHVAGRTLVKGLSFTVQPGERWCVIGRNAVGKSTLLRALAGLGAGAASAQAHAAKASTLQAAPGLRRAYLPQSTQDRFDLTVRELIALQPALALDDGALQARSDALGQALDITPLLERPITQLSGGERQRVGLAAVAAQEAPLWLLDEPVSFQDPAHQRMVAQWLHAQSAPPLSEAAPQKPHTGMVMSAHDMGWVQSVATHIIAAYDHTTWTTGRMDAMLNAQLLRDTFGCDWQQVGSLWMVR
jgi:iron complex transport system ATP-binding protein